MKSVAIRNEWFVRSCQVFRTAVNMRFIRLQGSCELVSYHYLFDSTKILDPATGVMLPESNQGKSYAEDGGIWLRRNVGLQHSGHWSLPRHSCPNGLLTFGKTRDNLPSQHETVDAAIEVLSPCQSNTDNQ